MNNVALIRKKIEVENCKKYKIVFEEILTDHIEKMQKRHSFLSHIVKDYTSLEIFVKEKRDFFELIGVRFNINKNSISLYFQLDYDEYKEFYVVFSEKEGLKVSQIVGWRNDVCSNEYLNIFTGETFYEEDAIFT